MKLAKDVADFRKQLERAGDLKIDRRKMEKNVHG
jgi:hypothetical protein